MGKNSAYETLFDSLIRSEKIFKLTQDPVDEGTAGGSKCEKLADDLPVKYSIELRIEFNFDAFDSVSYGT